MKSEKDRVYEAFSNILYNFGILLESGWCSGNHETHVKALKAAREVALEVEERKLKDHRERIAKDKTLRCGKVRWKYEKNKLRKEIEGVKK